MNVTFPDLPVWFVNFSGLLILAGAAGWLWMLRDRGSARARLRADISWLLWRPVPQGAGALFLWLVGLSILLQFMVFMVLLGLFGEAVYHTAVQHTVGMLLMHVWISAGLLWLTRRSAIPFSEVPAFGRAVFFRPLCAGTAGYVLALPLVLVGSLLTHALFPVFDLPIEPQDVVLSLQEYDRPWLWVILVLKIVFVGPLCEELVFRGYLLPWLAQRIGFWPGMILHSLFFAAIHLNAAAMLPLFALSCVLGLVYMRRQNLFSAFWMHAVFNAMTLVAFFLGNGEVG